MSDDKELLTEQPPCNQSELIKALGGKTAQQHCEDLKREAKQLLCAEGCSVEAADRIVTCIVMASVLEMSCVQAEAMQRLRRA